MIVSTLATPIRVDVGDLHVSWRAGDVLAAYGLGSCIGLVMYDCVAKVGGLAHIQLPASSRYSSSNVCRWAFADRGVPELLRRMREFGALEGRMRVVLAGGATVGDDGAQFEIGRKNFLATKALLWQHGIIISAQDVGGSQWRTMRLFIDSGKTGIESPNGKSEL